MATKANRISRSFLLLSLLVASIALLSASTPEEALSQGGSYDVVAVYQKEELPNNTKTIDRYGTMHDAKYLLVKTDLDYGDYSVEVKREESNLYSIRTADLYIETRYCYEYAYYDKAVLTINSRYGYTIGKLTFIK